MTDMYISINNRSEQIILELKSISSIKFGDYWNTTKCSPQKANLITSISRSFWYINESRELTIKYLENLINNVFLLINDIYFEIGNLNLELNNELSNILSILYVLLVDVQTGISNLKGIYHKDNEMIKKIDNVLDDIKIKYHKSKKYSKNKVNTKINKND